MAVKTEQQIERDFYTLLSGSSFGAALGGALYRDGMRPHGSTAEDATVVLLSGADEQVQTGVIVVNVYVPALVLVGTGQTVPDHARIATLEELLVDFVDSWGGSTEYRMESDSTPTTTRDEDTGEWVTTARIRYYRLTA